MVAAFPHPSPKMQLSDRYVLFPCLQPPRLVDWLGMAKQRRQPKQVQESPLRKAHAILQAEEGALQALGSDEQAVREQFRKLKARGAVRRYKRRRRSARQASPLQLSFSDKEKNVATKTLKRAKQVETRRKQLMKKPVMSLVRKPDQLRLKDMLVAFLSDPELPGEVPAVTPDGFTLTSLQRQVIRFDRLLCTLYSKAVEGDVGMMKIIMDRVMPVHKTGELELKITAEEHRSFLDRFRYGDTILRFGNEAPLIVEQAEATKPIESDDVVSPIESPDEETPVPLLEQEAACV